MKSALATPLISTAIKFALGMTANQAIGEFDRVREIFGQSYSDSGVWLYVVLGKQVKKDTRGWIDAALLKMSIGATRSNSALKKRRRRSNHREN